MTNQHKVAVIIATVDRREHLSNLIENLRFQSCVPNKVIISAPTLDDLSQNALTYPGWLENITGIRGAAAQRNIALDQLSSAHDYVFFFDDDTLPRSDFIQEAVDIFESCDEIVGITGSLIIDGASRKRAVTFVEARSALDSSWTTHTPARLSDVDSLYGCNFAVRNSAAINLRFDDALPLYSWLEDLDFSRRLARKGRLVRAARCVAVHHGSDSGGRTQHLRFGYSQVTNPIHLWRNGSINFPRVLKLILKPVSRNIIESIIGPDKADRRSRFRGNCFSFVDVVRGRVTPGRIMDM